MLDVMTLGNADRKDTPSCLVPTALHKALLKGILLLEVETIDLFKKACMTRMNEEQSWLREMSFVFKYCGGREAKFSGIGVRAGLKRIKRRPLLVSGTFILQTGPFWY